jgi:uncharacterized protein (DUF849 family)
MTAKKLILEMRLNEYKSRAGNHHIPFTPDEIAEAAAECRKAGASIVHFHARGADGSPCFDPEVYAECAAKIRERCDILLDVTLGQVDVAGDDNRLAHIVHMAKSPKTRPDFAAVDTGSTNVDAYDPVTKSFRSTHRAYVNSTATQIKLIEEMVRLGVQPSISVWTVPFIRSCDALIDAGILPTPTTLQIVLCDGGILGGHPNTPKGLLSMVENLPQNRKYEWFVCSKEGNMFAAAAQAIKLGGHLSPGLGDYEYPELGAPDNGTLAAAFATLSRQMGREVATPAETRAMIMAL